MRGSLLLAPLMGLALAAALAAPTAAEAVAGVQAASGRGAAEPAAPRGDRRRPAQRLLVHGGPIRIGDPQGTLVEALLVEDGRVSAVGVLDEVRALLGGAEALELDLEGAVAVPGLQDAHVRLEELGAVLAGLDLHRVRGEDELVRLVAERAALAERGAWIVGHGWDPGRMGLSGWPDALRLDEVAPEHPVLLWSVDRRAALVNRVALELSQIGAAPGGSRPARSRSPDGVLRDAQGAPSGVLLDEAAERVAALVPQPGREVRIERILRAQQHLIALGITCAHDMGTRHDALPLYRELLDGGRLRLRLVCYLDSRPGVEAARAAARSLPPDPLGRLTVAGIAITLDGSLGTRGAALLEPYADLATDLGWFSLEDGSLLGLLTAAARAGLQPALLATGDRATRLALDACRHAGLLEPRFARLRPRIEDALLVSTRDWPRFPELGAAVVAVPRRGADAEVVLERVGVERWRRMLAWLRLAPHLNPMALGSRAPEGEAGPLRAMQALRFGPGLRIEGLESGLEEEAPDGRLALVACTSAAAWACRQEESRGRLMPGYFADLTVLSVDPVEAGPEELAAARVLAVLIHGELVGP